MNLDCALIGGTLAERLQIATTLRRNGVCVWFDPRTSKSSFKRACAQSHYGKAVVYDLDRYGDRRYVTSERAFREDVIPQPTFTYAPPPRPDWFATARKMLRAGFDRDTVRDTLRIA